MDEIIQKIGSIQEAINQLNIRGREARQILNYIDNTCEDLKAQISQIGKEPTE